MASATPRFLPLRATVLVLAALGSAGALARDRGDHERAREAVVAGQILPLRTVLDRLEREQAGRVLEIELESEDRRWIYEVKLLQPDGQLQKLVIDAGTGEVIGRRVRPPRPPHGEPR
ncbi:PepSY domain-containing protein [Hydrogenophaga pseudoflava]|uniref:PepSY domain-containing protein n=1 Tax=Hydrogenophaga pseudoflava TaxID=47421 RepID=UPI0027E4298C|nr:PepSY domain-containing protein [Hydrogenophaga pseudoflava]MDQ7747070.1 PepSY domain-containing protein [Hydrogenophaga pseudoflava]